MLPPATNLPQPPNLTLPTHSSSISSVLATGLPISILSLAATNPAAASSWIASEVLPTKPTGSWYRALPTDVQAYLVAAASAAATATATASPSSPSASASVQASVDAKTYSYSAAAYHMSAGAVAAVVFGTIGFVMLCYGLFAWQARLGPFERWAPRDRPRHHGEGYERAASRAALQREFKGSKLDLSVYDDGGEVVELREGVGAKDGKGKAVQGGVVVAGGDTGEAGKDGVGGDGGGTNGRPQSGGRESVVTALPRYRPSVFGNAAGWKAGWPSVWLSRR